MAIHPTAIVDPKAQIGRDVSIGPCAVIGPDVTLGDRVQVASHVVIEGHTTVGPETEVFPFAMLGAAPGHLHDRGEGTELVVGAKCSIREHASLHRGAKVGTGRTVIGDGVAIFAHAHVGHDCVVEAGAILINGSMLAGHVQVGAKANIGGKVGIHQFVRVGTLAMVGGGATARLDVPPYCMAARENLALFGLNEVGLERNGVTPEAIKALRSAYRTIFRTDLPRAEALAKVRGEFPGVPEIAHLADFIESSKRGVARHGRGE